MNKHTHNESIHASDSCGVAVAQRMDTEAAMALTGKYRGECVGPVERLRDRYIYLRDKMNAALQRGDRFVAKAWGILLAAIPLEVKWADDIKNLVTTVGGNLALDTILAGSAYTAACYVGLTQTTPTPNIADTMSSHAGWVEAGATNAPTYTAPRKTPSWSAASGKSKATSAAMSFAITGTGTVGGCFLVLGSGASATIDSTTGVLYSAGAFTQGNKAVVNGDTVNVSYTAQA
jgi:hypothetical protein